LEVAVQEGNDYVRGRTEPTLTTID
jgi:hypothetical protein